MAGDRSSVELWYRASESVDDVLAVTEQEPLPVRVMAGSASPFFRTAQVVLSTTAAQIVPARTGRARVVVKNADTAITIAVGPHGVTTTNGVPLLPGESTAFHTAAAMFAVAASGTPTVALWEEYS